MTSSSACADAPNAMPPKIAIAPSVAFEVLANFITYSFLISTIQFIAPLGGYFGIK
jgi:hypothetical protein